jgi:hypothetical protein
MPHYNFHFTDGRHVYHDDEGLDLPNDAAAREEAELIAGDLWDDPGEGDWSEWAIRVTDESGRDITRIPIGHRSKVLRLVSGLGRRLAGLRQVGC